MGREQGGSPGVRLTKKLPSQLMSPRIQIPRGAATYKEGEVRQVGGKKRQKQSFQHFKYASRSSSGEDEIRKKGTPKLTEKDVHSDLFI